MKRSRRSFSSEKKAALVKEHLVQNRKVSEICEEHDIQPTQFYRWKEEFLSNAFKAFENTDRKKEEKVLHNKISKLEDKLIQKSDVISELLTEHMALKKSLGED
jgi:transposase-like protein